MEIRLNPGGIGVAFEREDPETGEPAGRKTLMFLDRAGPLTVNQVSIGPLSDEQWEDLKRAVNEPAEFVRQANARATLLGPGGAPVRPGKHPLQG